jgi:RNase P subunit RPR2
MHKEDAMLAMTCEKCRRRYTPTVEELQVYLAESEGRRYALVLCPHCGKGNKVGHDRINQALRFSPPAESGESGTAA